MHPPRQSGAMLERRKRHPDALPSVLLRGFESERSPGSSCEDLLRQLTDTEVAPRELAAVLRDGPVQLGGRLRDGRRFVLFDLDDSRHPR